MPVINERAVRVGAGILFVLGIIAYVRAIMDWPLTPLKPFGVVFMFDMAIRVTLGDRWSPVLAIGRFAVRSREPQWVGASQKEFAW